MLAYIYIPVIQKQLDIFKETVWNHSRGRKQNGKALPTGKPDFIYGNPEEFDAEDCGFAVTEDQILSIAEESGVLDDNDDFLDTRLRTRFDLTIPDVANIQPNDAALKFIELKERYIPE